jgi:hypothetical protein
MGQMEDFGIGQMGRNCPIEKSFHYPIRFCDSLRMMKIFTLNIIRRESM